MKNSEFLRKLGGGVWLLAAGYMLAVCVVGVLLHLVVRDFVRDPGSIGLGFEPRPGESASPGPGTPVATPTLVALDTTPEPWSGNSRVTILLMGLDYRDWEGESGAPRTDTMMLVTIDPLTREAGILSIPRDLWVEIPGFSHQRINTAYRFGELYRYPGGGPGLAVKTVESVIGVPIQYYAVIEFSAFERLIDEIGGIDVYVENDLKISPIGRMSRWLEGGKGHHLDGAETLAYARVRKGANAGGDFGRADRQQQVALAIIDRVVGFDMIPTLIGRAPRLYQEISAGIRTNLSLPQMVSFGWMAVNLPKDDIERGIIAPPGMVGFETRADGAQVLRPVPDQIRELRDRIFLETSAIGAPPDVIEDAGSR